MTQKQIDNPTELKQLILDQLKKQKFETTNQLIQSIKNQTSIPTQTITKTLLQLENDGRLQFNKKAHVQPNQLKIGLISQQASWFWITLILTIITAIAVFTIPQNQYPLAYLRIGLGIIFMLFLPGFVIIKTIFPHANPIKTNRPNLDIIERTGLSIAVSIALIPIIGIILNYTTWGITLTPMTLSLLGVTAFFATAAMLRDL